MTSDRSQVMYAKQQAVKRRVKRDFIMLPFPSSQFKSVFNDETGQNTNLSHHVNQTTTRTRATFPKNDPKWPDMWYLVSIVPLIRNAPSSEIKIPTRQLSNELL